MSIGYKFDKDTEEQAYFESEFPYEETKDQKKAIEDIKKDMEKSYPMDRLLCGDVGYGKTEVAIRAAFKAVMDQKQVAYLVPTTVLADQQYAEFKRKRIRTSKPTTKVPIKKQYSWSQQNHINNR